MTAMKGDYSGFGGSGGEGSAGSGVGGGLQNGLDYNVAGSSSVGQVDSVQTLSEAHSIPTSGSPNSVTRNYRNGSLCTERYYGGDGKPYLDIDYSDHGNPSTHRTVPHEHSIHFDAAGKMHRGKDTGIKK